MISPEYSSKDLVEAPVEYARLGQLQQYIVIDSRKRAAWSHIRQNDGRFVLVPAENLGVDIPCEDLTLSFADVYAGTRLDVILP